MSADPTIPADIEGHDLGPFVGFEAVGFYAICGGDECGARFDGASPAEVVDYYEQHYSMLCLAPGVGKARAALAEALARKAAS